MQVLLIHDVNSPTAAVGLCVSVGSLHEPVDWPGLAHFCEHMVHEGEEYINSDKYPTGRIGSDRAATVFRETNYESSIHHDALEDKIQRFASFLSRPVFLKNVMFEQDDERRIADLDKYLSKCGDPWSAFDIGNWETLTAAGKVPPSHGKIDDSAEWIDPLRSKLQEWYSKYYCGNRMHLVVIDPIDELTSMATKYFSPVTAGTTVVLVKTVKELREIEVRWIMPSQTLLYRVKPLNYLTRFLHHQGEGSLYRILHDRGWIDGLSASRCEGDRECGFETYHVAFTVTESGWHAWEAVVAALHKYISLVRDTIIKDPDFTRAVQQELCPLSELDFRFRETLKPAAEAKLLSSNLAKRIPPADLIMAPPGDVERSRKFETCGATWHRTPLHEIMRVFDLQPTQMEKIYSTVRGPKWEPVFKARIPLNIDQAIEEVETDPAEVKVFTDGSCIDGGVGAAAVLYRGSVEQVVTPGHGDGAHSLRSRAGRGGHGSEAPQHRESASIRDPKRQPGGDSGETNVRTIPGRRAP
ncbi:Metalloenzyme, LuxS/M16 peptidase-like protein [Gautieria morchelliformis]|nr:Metalloenzyme, LuxS/M16 peptidase-like protein [Gautieria morchelliformis]